MWWSGLHYCFWTPINMPHTHTYKHRQRRVGMHTYPHVFSLLFFFLSLNKSIWQPKPQRSPMHGLSLRLHSQRNKLKALGESQKKVRDWEKQKTKKQNNLSAPTTIPHCHLHITPHPTLSPAQLPTWKETGWNDIMHMKMSRKMFDLCMH